MELVLELHDPEKVGGLAFSLVAPFQYPTTSADHNDGRGPPTRSTGTGAERQIPAGTLRRKTMTPSAGKLVADGAVASASYGHDPSSDSRVFKMNEIQRLTSKIIVDRVRGSILSKPTIGMTNKSLNIGPFKQSARRFFEERG